MALHFSKATPVDIETIQQQQGGWGRRGPEDFSVTEPRAVRQVIPSNKRGKKKKRRRRRWWWRWRVWQPQWTLLRPWHWGQWLEPKVGPFIPACVETLAGSTDAAAVWAQCWGESVGVLQRQREKEGVLDWRGCGRVKWQARGRRQEEEAGVAGRDSSQVTKTAGLRTKMSTPTHFTLLYPDCSDLNSVFFSRSVSMLDLQVPKSNICVLITL